MKKTEYLENRKNILIKQREIAEANQVVTLAELDEKISLIGKKITETDPGVDLSFLDPVTRQF